MTHDSACQCPTREPAAKSAAAARPFAQPPACLAASFFLTMAVGLWSGAVAAEPWAEPGDPFLRHDVELLVDSGVIDVPLTTWPMSWGDLARVTAEARLPEGAPEAVAIALMRLRARARDEASIGYTRVDLGVAVAEKPRQLRSFEDNPRENGEFSVAASRTWERFSGRVEFTYAANPSDDEEYRFDGSYASYIWGNTTFNLGLQDKWWGPAWAGTLALSTNARPVPGLLVKRNFTQPFEHRWLSWIGPWTASFLFGQLESDRPVPNAKLVGARFAFRPLRSLELGITRTAQWGGDGRDESLRSFIDLVLGRDNVGDSGISEENEPGNQLAGYDWRWRVKGGRQPVVFYGQLIGEDEAGGFPSRFLGQMGLSWSSPVGTHGDSLHANFEISDTTCQFYKTNKLFNCAYNNSLYPAGYRYRGRPIGHSSDADSRQFSLGTDLLRATGERYTMRMSFTEVNRGGPRDEYHSLSPTPSDLINIELSHERALLYGLISAGIGLDHAESDDQGLDGTDVRGFFSWQREY